MYLQPMPNPNEEIKIYCICSVYKFWQLDIHKSGIKIFLANVSQKSKCSSVKQEENSV